MACLPCGIPAFGMTPRISRRKVSAAQISGHRSTACAALSEIRQIDWHFVCDDRSMGEFVAVTGVRDRSVLATLGGVVAETPSPLDANADATVGDLADGPTLALVGLAGRAAARCYELSSVERWRLALARAVAMRRVPVIVDCSRGTPAPRPGLGTLLLGLRDAGATLFAVTDDDELVGYADRVVTARNGRLTAGPSGAATLDRTRVIHELLRGMT